MASLAHHLRQTRLPLVPLLPAIVVVIGLASAIAVGFLGLRHLRSTSDQVAANRAAVLASSLAARLRATASEDHRRVALRAARRTGSEVLILTHDGTIAVDATLDPPTSNLALALAAAEQGLTNTSRGRSAFSARTLGVPFQNRTLIVFVEPRSQAAASALVTAGAVLTTLLIGVAAIVAFLFARDLHADVDFVRREIARMAEREGLPTGKPVSIRVADQVGLLTHAFNVLVDRFTAADHAFRLDLDRVATLDRDRAAFLGALSHELRTPLNAILGFADVLLSEVDGPLDSDTRENLEMVRTSGSHLRGLIDDILELSALESGQLRLSPHRIDIYAVAEDVTREASARLSGKPITLTVTGTSPTLTMADERRIWQILSNLVGNAIKFTEQGSVNVDVSRDDNHVVITVADTGTGIPDAELDTIFDEYRQLDGSSTREKGTGLGLFIARRLVRMHKGEISVRSEVNRGSRFTVRIPTVESEPTPISEGSNSLSTEVDR